ncbi:MAG: heat-inducible transcriptional repressor HrcA [Pseudomonadales bacterium]|jgi:heat-inducible transcriptional repressor|nr:heat-inducible transcriptional repressor HrcA [Pseudomonadales bacterium]MDP6469623.1 heat-inducible transcriptional repressor HrcA [Pseudomonadales bacterium]MDP6827464.1 heat-inducible transcriptional repressor HrcA [Pseudomonadales bacterium]MDP6973191.1 heat-inducible transcriptional repressor HrcA [Pseudomonadales bacterium]|tara:strand:+ start:289 stop:1317 length:1029 start_codon:yes stop_codon:yes gene_type:complete
MDDEVGNRAQQMFKLLVESYIEDGRPVASKALARRPGVDVSSATVRNIMSELERVGLVRSPHTSAGKVPTSVGLRFFVDSLLSVEPLDEHAVRDLERELNPDLAPAELVASASNLLSQVTQMTCIVTLPRHDRSSLRHVEFLKMEGDRVLVILVFNNREVQNRVIHTEREYGTAELIQAANYLNQEFQGLSLRNIRNALLDSMQRDKDRMDNLMQSALDMAAKTFGEESEDEQEFVVAGESRLLDFSEDTETVRTLFEAFSRKGSVLHLLDQSLESDGIQLFIGEESGFSVMDDLSLVSAPYEVNGRVAGVLGVVGPTHMDYQEVIPIVDVTARVLGAALNY